MEKEIIYCGFFLDEESMGELCKSFPGKRLDRVIENPHITTAFRPETVDASLLGEKIDVAVVGYGNDGRNEGVLVSFGGGSERARSEFEKVDRPHVTMSVGNGGQPVYTFALNFADCDRDIKLRAKFGVFCADRTVCFGEE